MNRRACTILAVGLALGAAALPAQVELITRPDGSILIKGKGRPAPRLRLSMPAQELLERIEHFATREELEPKLVQSLIQTESAFNRYAVSRKGAQGLMQLMPATAAELGVDDPFDIDQNLAGGTRYLKRLLERYDGDLVLGLAAYNAGPEAVAHYGGVPPYRETRNYVQRVLTLFRGEAPVLPVSGSLRGRPAYLVRRNGRWLMTSDRKVAQAAETRPAGGSQQDTSAALGGPSEGQPAANSLAAGGR